MSLCRVSLYTRPISWKLHTESFVLLGQKKNIRLCRFSVTAKSLPVNPEKVGAVRSDLSGVFLCARIDTTCTDVPNGYQGNSGALQEKDMWLKQQIIHLCPNKTGCDLAFVTALRVIKLSDNPGKPGFGQFIVTYVSTHSGGNIHKYRFPRVPVCKPVFLFFSLKIFQTCWEHRLDLLFWFN